ncbi:MAG: O-antigen ligase family protein [Myxococcota bacterium]
MPARASFYALIAFALLLGLFEGPAEIAAVVALALLVASGGFKDARLNIADIGMLVWLLAGTISLIHSPAKLGSEPNLRPLLALTYLLGRFAIAPADEAELRRLALFFSAACVINGLYGIFQVWVFDPPLEALIVGRRHAQHLVDPDAQDRLRMATGLFYNRVKLAHLGMLGLGLLGLIADAARRRQQPLWRPLGAALILGLAVFLSYRRAAPVALLAAGLVLALLLRRLRLAVSVLAGVGLILALYGLTDYGRERMENTSLDVSERLEMVRAAVALILDHPLLGVGHGGYGPSIGPYLPPMASETLIRNAITNPHNLSLQILAETGIVGFSGFAVAIAASLAALTLAIRRDREVNSPQATLDRFAFLGLVALLGLGLVHAVLYQAPVGMAFWTLLGVASARIESAGA